MQIETELTDYEHHVDSSPTTGKQSILPTLTKSKNYLKIILMILFYICSFFTFYGRTLIFIALYLFMIFSNRNNKFGLSLAVIAFFLSVLNPFFEYNLLAISQIVMSLGMLTFDFAQRMWREISLVWDEIKNLVITMFFVLCICAYAATAYYDDDLDVAIFYGTFGRSVLTFVQALSLDDWAQIGRQTDDLFGYFILCIYILLMTYFYLNIMMGILIETLQFDKKGKQMDDPFNYDVNQKQIIAELVKDQSILDKCIIGIYYQYVVFIISFGGIFISILEHFDHGDSTFELVIELIDDSLYTIHFILLLFRKGPIYDIERRNIIMMALHFIAGPLSLIFSFFFLEIGCLLNLLKMATTPSVKGIFVGTLNMIPLLLPQFTELFGILMFIASILTFNYYAYTGLKQQEYFSSFWGSVYTLVQIMTLDDWGNIVEPMYSKHGFILPYLIIPVYIFLSNFIILNTLIALSCEYFVEVQFYKIEKDHNDARSSQFVGLNELQNYCNQNKIQFNIPKITLSYDHILSAKIKQDTIIQIQQGNKLFTVQVQQQSDAL